MTRKEMADQVGQQVHRFHGGLHLRHHKQMSCGLPLQHTPLPPRFYVPLVHYAGQEAQASVSAGQKVLKGEPIAHHSHSGIACVHAPTSGIVKAVARRPSSHVSGKHGWCVVIQPDGTDQWKSLEPINDWKLVDPSVLRHRIRSAGIVGLGGAAFPTDVKVDDASEREPHTLILNGTECEPYISCDEMLMREQPDSILLGAKILQRAIGAARVVIAIEDNADAVNLELNKALSQAGTDPGGIDIVRVPTIYPEGGEKQLIQVLTGQEVPSGGRPADLGLLCQNVATATAVARAVVEDKPLIERVVTISGGGVRKPRNLIARIGTPIEHLIDQCGGYTENAARLVLGGPMMGYALDSDNNPMIKAANCILVLTELDVQPLQVEMPCIRCGECARVCPAVLLPQQLNGQIRNQQWTDATEHGLLDCIECGCCDFVCPSHIPLVEWFRFGKAQLRLREEERALAHAARMRFESREARLAQQKAKRRQRIQEKKDAMRSELQKQKELTDAIARVRSRKDDKA